jgi:hypothetical protein
MIIITKTINITRRPIAVYKYITVYKHGLMFSLTIGRMLKGLLDPLGTTYFNVNEVDQSYIKNIAITSET